MKPTPEKIAKLPKWAQEHLTDLTRQLESSQASLTRFSDNQTPSPFYVDEWNKNSKIKRFIQTADRSICADHAGCHVELFLARKDDGQRPFGIQVSISAMGEWGRNGNVCFVPSSSGKIFIMHKDNL